MGQNWMAENEELVYSHYLGACEVGEMYKSPLRQNDTNPSFGLYVKDGRIKWKDFGIDQEGADAIALVSYMFGISRDRAFEKIKREVDLRRGRVQNKLIKRSGSKSTVYVEA